MNRSQSLHSFWSGFEINAYDENSVPDEAKYPYITYSVALDNLENTIPLSASIWYRSTSWAEISEKAEEISNALKDGVVIKLEKGYTYLTKGTPFAQRTSGGSDDMIKHIYLNINAQYLTN